MQLALRELATACPSAATAAPGRPARRQSPRADDGVASSPRRTTPTGATGDGRADIAARPDQAHCGRPPTDTSCPPGHRPTSHARNHYVVDLSRGIPVSVLKRREYLIAYVQSDGEISADAK
jgi:hypothetical protein